MERKLAAILAADVVGYSKMMGRDEEKALSSIFGFRDRILVPEVKGNRGNIIKSMGDGWLVEFDSVVDAINCSMKIQDKLGKDKDDALKLRIGVHVGDVIRKDEDIFGDGVNMAARLESIAEPGGIAISDVTYSSLDGTLTPSFDSAGKVSLKNIERPVEVWLRGSLLIEEAVQAPTPTHAAAARSGFPQLVIEPLNAKRAEEDVQELAAALTFDLEANFSAIRWLDLAPEAQKDGAYRLTGGLRSRGGKMRLECQLISASGETLWRYKKDGDIDDSFDFQDEAGEEIAAELIGALLDFEVAKLSDLDESDMTAEQFLLRGMMAYRSVSHASFEACLDNYAKAIELSPTLAEAFAEAIFMTIGGGTTGFRNALDRYFQLLPSWVEAAGALSAKDPLLDLSLAVARYMQDGQIAPILAKVDDCLRRAPFDVQVLVFSGWGQLWAGRAREALDCFLKAERFGKFSPYYVAALGGVATASVLAGDDETAIDYAERGLKIAHEYPTLYACLASARALAGDATGAGEALAAYHHLVPGQTIAERRAAMNYGGTDGAARFYDGLRRAGMAE